MCTMPAGRVWRSELIAQTRYHRLLSLREFDQVDSRLPPSDVYPVRYTQSCLETPRFIGNTPDKEGSLPIRIPVDSAWALGDPSEGPPSILMVRTC